MSFLYHGSDHIIRTPRPDGGRAGNDYGMGFYCTKDTELAREWACLSKNGGFMNSYEFNDEGLRILDLTSDEYSALNWIALLLNNREIRLSSPIEEDGKRYIIDHYLPDISNVDVIIGYRADDSFFSFARAFLRNTLSYGQLQQVLMYGDLGLQYVLISKESFERIKFRGAEAVDGDEYYQRRRSRDLRAREDYRKLVRELDRQGIFLNEIIQGGVIDERI